MNADIVKEYTMETLVPRLYKAELTQEQVAIISNDISLRLESLLAVWNDQDYTNTLFEIVKEEALFYRPKSHISIRCLVVIGIRNSCIEDAHSTAAFNPKLKTSAENSIHSSQFIKDLTSEAIQFFKSNIKRSDDFSSMYQNTGFAKLDEKYPRAWKALSPRKIPSPFSLNSQEAPILVNILEDQASSNYQTTLNPVESGIDPNFDQALLNQLKHLWENAGDTIFFAPSFKHISRDLEKVLQIIEFLLYAKVPIVTGNYLLTADKASVRKPFLKPIHNNHEMLKIVKNTSGVSKDHARHLRNIAKNLS